MSIWESLKTAIQSIFSNKMRSSLTMLGIVIGVCSVVLLVALGQGFQTSMTTTFEDMGASALYVSSSSSQDVKVVRSLTFEDAEALEDKNAAPAIGTVSPTLTQMVNASYGNNSATVQLTGVIPSVLEIRNYEIAAGRFISERDVMSPHNFSNWASG